MGIPRTPYALCTPVTTELDAPLSRRLWPVESGPLAVPHHPVPAFFTGAAGGRARSGRTPAPVRSGTRPGRGRGDRT